jgi:hypothetical protein
MLHAFMTTCHVKELMDNQYEFEDDDNLSLDEQMPPEIPLRSQFNHISEHLVANVGK